MITRKQYMNREFTHEEYYSQFVTDGILNLVGKIQSKIDASEDENFNDIPLVIWDQMSKAFGYYSDVIRAISKTTAGGVSLSDKVCVLKQAARIIKKRQE